MIGLWIVLIFVAMAGSTISGGKPSNDFTLPNTEAIPFDTVQQVCLTPVAYTIGTDFKPGPRTSLEDHVHWNRW